jgi:hypothetical protein
MRPYFPLFPFRPQALPSRPPVRATYCGYCYSWIVLGLLSAVAVIRCLRLSGQVTAVSLPQFWGLVVACSRPEAPLALPCLFYYCFMATVSVACLHAVS